MSAPIIWAGSFAKLLKDQLKFKDTARILTGTADPSSSATDGEKGSLYMRVGGSGGTLYQKQDNGSSTNWSIITGSGFNVNTILVNASGDVLTNGTNVLVSG